MIKIEVEKLCFELTRRCNASCLHCMRGDDKNIDLSIDDINNIFKKDKCEISTIKTLIFTGGEPFLNKKAFLYILNYIMDNDINVYNFSCITNSLIYDKQIMDTLNKFKVYIDEKRKINPDYILYRNSLNLLTKADQFHPETPKDTLDNLKQYSFYQFKKKQLDDKNIFYLGRAKDNGMGNINLTEIYLNRFYEDNKNSVFLDNFYITNEDVYVCLSNIYVNSYGKFANIKHIDGSWDLIDEICKHDLKYNSIFTNVYFSNEVVDKLKIFISFGLADSLLPIFNEEFKIEYERALKDSTLDIFADGLNYNNINNYLIKSEVKSKKID